MKARRIQFRLVPYFATHGWSGDVDDCDNWVEGRSVTFAWLGFYLEIALALETK